MKKFKKSFVALALCACIAVGMTGFSACFDEEKKAPEGEKNQITEVYELYKSDMEAAGQTALSYDDWYANLLETARGENGKDGANGAVGKSAYDVWLDEGNEGAEEDYLNSLKGANGDVGKSAYDVWLDEGNTGNEQDFLNSLKGAKGDSGDNGTNGANGSKGATGDAGQRGTKITYGAYDPYNDDDDDCIDGDLYIQTETWHLYRYDSSQVVNKWVDCGCIKGEDGKAPVKGDPVISFGHSGKAEIIVNLEQGLYIIKADMSTKINDTTSMEAGRLQATIGSDVSELAYSEEKSTAAGLNHYVYFGYINVEVGGDTTITFSSPTNDAVTDATITFEQYTEPTITADRAEVIVPVNLTNKDTFKVRIDPAVTGSFKWQINDIGGIIIGVTVNDGTNRGTNVTPTYFNKPINRAVTLTDLSEFSVYNKNTSKDTKNDVIFPVGIQLISQTT